MSIYIKIFQDNPELVFPEFIFSSSNKSSTACSSKAKRKKTIYETSLKVRRRRNPIVVVGNF